MKEELIKEVNRLRYLAGRERLLPQEFDNLMEMLDGTTWAEENGEERTNQLHLTL